jgi:thiamine biosynthesis protein ThiS
MILLNGRKAEWEAGMTVASLIRKKNYTFPLLVVSIDGKHVPPKKYEATSIPDESDVRVLHLGQGG